jgi:hypothetical protein
MKKLLRKFETMMTAVAFAEAGEHETARQIINEDKAGIKRKKIRKTQRPEKRMKA